MADLRRLQRDSDSGRLASQGVVAETPAPGGAPSSRTTRRWTWGLSLATALVAIAASVFLLTGRESPSRGSGTHSAESRDPTRLVVLPFENLGAPDDSYFAAGMTEELTSRLAGVSGLGVVSRSTAIRYQDTDKTLKQNGAEVGVDFVLEGTVRWDRGDGDTGRVRITPQLIRVADDTLLWTDRYDRVLDDVFAAQSEIAGAVVGQLGVALLPAERDALEKKPTESVEAYQAYSNGLEHSAELLRRPTRADLELAVRMFERAVELDPAFVEAHGLLARAHLDMFSYDATPERLAQARQAVDRAIALDPESPEAHLALACSARSAKATTSGLSRSTRSSHGDVRTRAGWPGSSAACEPARADSTRPSPSTRRRSSAILGTPRM